MKNRGFHKTDIETLMREALKKEGIEVVEQFPIRCKYRYLMDFAIPSKKICIECDGEPWHLIGNRHDRKRDGFMKSRGWRVLRFRGEQIRNHIQQCVDEIKFELAYS